jgi:hypothetical protein
VGDAEEKAREHQAHRDLWIGPRPSRPIGGVEVAHFGA